MTNRLSVKEHLRNAALYRPLTEPSTGMEWKGRLLRQYSMDRQLNDALHAKNGILKLPVCIAVPVACLFLVFSAYFGFLPLGQWFEYTISSIDALKIPPIGLKEIFVFAALVNGLTFLIKERRFFL
jgi:TRAP-type uncharacterized transport system fused permease subunit